MNRTLLKFLRKESLLKTGLILGLALNTGSAISQTQIIPVVKPKPGFGLDGKVQVESSTSGDWINTPTILNATTPAEGIFTFDPSTGNILNAPQESSIWYRDLWNNGSDEMFGSGAKFVDNPTVMVITKGKPPTKNDINNAFYHVSIDNSGNPYLFIAGDRYSTTGTSYIDFEFLQGELGYNGAQTGFEYKDGNNRSATGGRTVGDIVISMEYSGGGSTAIAYVYKWKLVSGVYTYNLEGQFNLAEFNTYKSAAVTNVATVPMAGGAFGKTSYAPYAFVEAAVNLSAQIFSSGTGGCDAVTFKTIFVKTKASNSSTAALKDFIPPQKINLQLGGVGLSYPSYNCTNLSPILSGTVASGGTFKASSTDLKIDGLTGVINYGASKNGTYTVTFTKTINTSCQATATATVTVANYAPVLNCPGDKVVECGPASNYATTATGVATASISCGSANVTFSDGSMTSFGCTKYFTRTWTAVDPNTGLSSTCVQKISIRDRTAPTATTPQTVNLICGASLPAAPTATDNCSATVQTMLVSVTEVSGNSTGCKDLVRKYTYMDESGNVSAEITQNIVFSDPTPVTPSNITTETTLSQSNPLYVKAYPNPFNSQVNFDLKSNVSGQVKLALYDISGRSLGLVYQGMVNAGDQRTINIDGQKYGTGTLIYRLTLGDQIVTGKLLKPVQQP